MRKHLYYIGTTYCCKPAKIKLLISFYFVGIEHFFGESYGKIKKFECYRNMFKKSFLIIWICIYKLVGRKISNVTLNSTSAKVNKIPISFKEGSAIQIRHPKNNTVSR